ncbi:MAG TPA: hypothetical protein VJK48_05230 [Chlamydiales bacterium]|nr:hypothetical protein [Chlamydiales bacterium]
MKTKNPPPLGGGVCQENVAATTTNRKEIAVRLKDQNALAVLASRGF